MLKSMQRVAMARGVLILDENLYDLQAPLVEMNFKVHPATTRTKDEQIIPMLTHRVFVTNNPKDFLEAAQIHEFSIIDTTLAPKDPQTLAGMISKAWISQKLRSRQSFLARIMKSGKTIVTELDEG